MRFEIDRLLRARTVQLAGLVLTILCVAALHARNDGLWLQGDSPRHAANGLFWWDYVRALPVDPTTFAVRYYARYPVITPATYPPLFHLLEGLAFQLFGASPHVAKGLVLAFAVLAGFYTMAWARQWVAQLAGWAGAFLAFVPSMVTWSNAVMLNVPAMALSLACLYHFRRWREASRRSDLVATVSALAATFLTYFQAASVLAICVSWLLFLRGERSAKASRSTGARGARRFSRAATSPMWPRMLVVCAIALVGLVPLALAMYAAPAQLSRHLPSMTRLLTLRAWTFYWAALVEIGGVPLAILAAAGAAAGARSARWRAEVLYLAIWIGALVVALTLLPAKDPRYILLAAPAMIILAAIGIAAIAPSLPNITAAGQAGILAAGLAAGFWSATRVRIPTLTGFREIAEYVTEQGPHDAVLYDGYHDGLFGFYFRALDPRFERRMVRGDKLLYDYSPRTTFRWIAASRAASPEEMVDLVRRQCGCRWLAIEIGPYSERIEAQRLLRRAVKAPAFALVRSFSVSAYGAERVDLYALRDPVTPVTEVDLTFPAFTDRPFTHVLPITR